MLALCLIAWASFLCGAATTGSIISYESFYLGRRCDACVRVCRRPFDVGICVV
jgi:hypothetical protein